MNDLKHLMQRLCQLAIGRMTGSTGATDEFFCTALKRVAQKQGGVLSTDC